MKAYVTRYEERLEEELPRRQLPYGKDIDVFYHKEPKWVTSHQEAESMCLQLHQWRVHAGDHYCQFSVEEQPEGGFAIVCKEHPDWEVGKGKQ